MEDEKFEKLVKSFYTYLTEDKHEYLSLFSRLQIQIEGWFKGELMCHFERQKIALTNKDREVTVDSEKSNNKEKTITERMITHTWYSGFPAPFSKL